ncbi:hypothetical protein [Maridesulfovibrio sp.]|uniref:hypothetical protein n=1 Tax=Maridesulfovibrio sp. TaxID=2795000 RepID=UPI00374A5A78
MVMVESACTVEGTAGAIRAKAGTIANEVNFFFMNGYPKNDYNLIHSITAARKVPAKMVEMVRLRFNG